MTLHPFRGSLRSIAEIVEISGIKRTTIESIKYRHPERSYDQIVDEFKKRGFSWREIADSIGIVDTVLHERVKRHGLEKALLMSPERRPRSPADKKKATKLSGTMTNPELPSLDEGLPLKKLIASLKRLGFTGDKLKHEAMRRAVDY